jgi:hypothetical protein
MILIDTNMLTSIVMCSLLAAVLQALARRLRQVVLARA